MWPTLTALALSPPEPPRHPQFLQLERQTRDGVRACLADVEAGGSIDLVVDARGPTVKATPSVAAAGACIQQVWTEAFARVQPAAHLTGRDSWSMSWSGPVLDDPAVVLPAWTVAARRALRGMARPTR